MVTHDYLKNRQNVIQAEEPEELNRKLGAIVKMFGLEWLESDGSNPIQTLWKRPDALATNELLNFGDALETLMQESPDWLKAQVEVAKSDDKGNRDGAIFEILALNLFSRKSCTVVPAPEDKPGFDATLVLKDEARVLVSIKNHGMSSHEEDFLRRAKDFDTSFQDGLERHGLSDTELRVISPDQLTPSLWATLETDTEECLRRFKAGQMGGTINRPYQMVLKPIDISYQPTSAFKRSSGCIVIAPQHKNEQANFVEAIRKGCENLLRHTRNETGDVCRMIILRLSATASIQSCREWAAWYFQEYPDDPLDVIILYQSAVVTDHAADTSSIIHHIVPITGPKFLKWQAAGPGRSRRLPNMSVLVGQIADSQPSMTLTDGSMSLDLSRYYTYQRMDIFKKVDASQGPVDVTLSNPAPGVMIHLALESDGQPTGVITMKTGKEKMLLLLP